MSCLPTQPLPLCPHCNRKIVLQLSVIFDDVFPSDVRVKNTILGSAEPAAGPGPYSLRPLLSLCTACHVCSACSASAEDAVHPFPYPWGFLCLEHASSFFHHLAQWLLLQGNPSIFFTKEFVFIWFQFSQLYTLSITHCDCHPGYILTLAHLAVIIWLQVFPSLNYKFHEGRHYAWFCSCGILSLA